MKYRTNEEIMQFFDLHIGMIIKDKASNEELTLKVKDGYLAFYNDNEDRYYDIVFVISEFKFYEVIHNG